MVIAKETSGSGNWYIYHSALGAGKYLQFKNTAATTASFAWGAGMTSSVIGARTAQSVDSGETHIAYAFHSVDGIQKVGSYTGTGAAGNMIETGFEPAFLMIKKTSGTSRWRIVDNKRDTSNPRSKNLFAEDNIAETGRPTHTTQDFNFLSNGFEIPAGMDGELNGNNDTFIYLAIAADPDTTTPTVEDSFEVVTYTGNGSTQDIDTGFKPDFVWVKERTTSEGHRLYDSVRGATKHLNSENTGAEATNSAGLTSFDSNGFGIGSYAPVNTNNEDYVAWCWKAGDHDDNLPQINTEGTIDSTVSVNDAAGFSIVKYNKSSGSTATVGHGLSSAPELIIVKTLDVADTWRVYVSALGGTKYINLNNSDAAATASSVWNNTDPTSTVFSLGTDGSVGNGDMIGYCFTSVTGYQKIGSYTGTGTTNSITGVGFEPRFTLIKRTDVADNWVIHDAVRDTTDPRTKILLPNGSDAEYDNSLYGISYNQDGFTLEQGYTAINASGGTYIYLAIA